MKILKFLPILLFISGTKAFAAYYYPSKYDDDDIRAEKDFSSFTPLHLAAMHEPKEGIKVLIEGGADVNATTKVVKFTPLHLAALHGHIENMRILIANGANVRAKTRQEFTPLHMASAAHTHNPEAVEFLLSQNDGIDINERTVQGYTPLMIAVINFTKAIDFFLQAGADFYAVVDSSNSPYKGLTPFHLAAAQKESPSGEDINLQSFIDAGADVNSPVKSGAFKSFYPLHLTASANSAEKTRTLLSNKADIEATTNKGHTPLHIAALNNSYHSAKVLFNAGANIYAKNHKGHTPPRIAKSDPDGYTHIFFQEERRKRRQAKLANFKSMCQRIFSKRSHLSVSQK